MLGTMRSCSTGWNFINSSHVVLLRVLFHSLCLHPGNYKINRTLPWGVMSFMFGILKNHGNDDTKNHSTSVVR